MVWLNSWLRSGGKNLWGVYDHNDDLRHRLVIDVFIIWQSTIISLSYNLRVNSPVGGAATRHAWGTQKEKREWEALARSLATCSRASYLFLRNHPARKGKVLIILRYNSFKDVDAGDFSRGGTPIGKGGMLVVSLRVFWAKHHYI